MWNVRAAILTQIHKKNEGFPGKKPGLGICAQYTWMITLTNTLKDHFSFNRGMQLVSRFAKRVDDQLTRKFGANEKQIC
jgi:hypothetical protein